MKMSMKLAFKVCILGDPGVGKTSLIIRFIENKFKENYIPTLGVDFLTKKLQVGKDKVPTTLTIWDIGGQWKERLHLYLQGSDGAIIIYDITRKTTFNSVSDWLNYVLEYSGEIPFLIVGNKLDLAAQRKVTLEEAISLAETINNAEILEASAKTGKTVNMMFSKIAEKIIINKAKKQIKKSEIEDSD